MANLNKVKDKAVGRLNKIIQLCNEIQELEGFQELLQEPDLSFVDSKLSMIAEYCGAMCEDLASFNQVKITRTTALKRSGWNAKKLDALYPNPDLVKNPHYACASPMKLYDVRKLEALEQVGQC